MVLDKSFDMKLTKVYYESKIIPIQRFFYNTFIDNKPIGFIHMNFYTLENSTSEDMIQELLDIGFNTDSKVSEIACFYPLGRDEDGFIEKYKGNELGRVALERCILDSINSNKDLMYVYSEKEHFKKLIKKNGFNEIYTDNFYKKIKNI